MAFTIGAAQSITVTDREDFSNSNVIRHDVSGGTAAGDDFHTFLTTAAGSITGLTATTADQVGRKTTTVTWNSTNNLILVNVGTLRMIEIGDHFYNFNCTGTGRIWVQRFGGTDQTDTEMVFECGYNRYGYNQSFHHITYNQPVISNTYMRIKPHDDRSDADAENITLFCVFGGNAGGRVSAVQSTGAVVTTTFFGSYNRDFDWDSLPNANLTGTMSEKVVAGTNDIQLGRYPHISSATVNFGSSSGMYCADANSRPENRPVIASQTNDTFRGGRNWHWPNAFVSALAAVDSDDANSFYPGIVTGSYDPSNNARSYVVRDYNLGAMSFVRFGGGSNGGSFRNTPSFVVAPGAIGEDLASFRQIRNFHSRTGNVFAEKRYLVTFQGTDGTGHEEGFIARHRDTDALSGGTMDYTNSFYKAARRCYANHDLEHYSWYGDNENYREAGLAVSVRPTDDTSGYNSGIGQAPVIYRGSYTMYFGGPGRTTQSITDTPVGSGNTATPSVTRQVIENYWVDSEATYAAISALPLRYRGMNSDSDGIRITQNLDHFEVRLAASMEDIALSISNLPTQITKDFRDIEEAAIGTGVADAVVSEFWGSTGYGKHLYDKGWSTMDYANGVATLNEKSSSDTSSIQFTTLPTLRSDDVIRALRIEHGGFDLERQAWDGAVNGQLRGDIVEPVDYGSLSAARSNNSFANHVFTGQTISVEVTGGGDVYLSFSDCSGPVTVERTGSGTGIVRVVGYYDDIDISHAGVAEAPYDVIEYTNDLSSTVYYAVGAVSSGSLDTSTELFGTLAAGATLTYNNSNFAAGTVIRNRFSLAGYSEALAMTTQYTASRTVTRINLSSLLTETPYDNTVTYAGEVSTVFNDSDIGGDDRGFTVNGNAYTTPTNHPLDTDVNARLVITVDSDTAGMAASVSDVATVRVFQNLKNSTNYPRVCLRANARNILGFTDASTAYMDRRYTICAPVFFIEQFFTGITNPDTTSAQPAQGGISLEYTDTLSGGGAATFTVSNRNKGTGISGAVFTAGTNRVIAQFDARGLTARNQHNIATFAGIFRDADGNDHYSPDRS